MSRALSTACLVFVLLLPVFATLGVFRGSVVKGPDSGPGWIYVKSRNGMVRRVEVSHAQVHYAREYPVSARKKSAGDALVEGAEVRVSAEQDDGGEWRASDVEILPPGTMKSAPRTTHLELGF